jgi:hypothetical protein
MADVYRGSVAAERRHHERRASWIPTLERGRLRVSWGGIWAGMLITLGSLLLLTTLGLAVGITAVDPGESDAGAFGTGAGIWGIVSALLALFVGGMVSTRSAAIADRGTSVFHGALVWLLTILVIAYLATSGIRMIAGGAFALAGGAMQTATVAATGGSGVDLSGSVDDIAARIRDPETAQRMASLTGLPLPEVQTHLERTAQNVEASGGDTQQAAQAAQQGFTDLMQRAQETGSLGRQVERQAEEAQPEAAAAAWGTLAALLLSLAAAVGGAMVGIKRYTARPDASMAT